MATKKDATQKTNEVIITMNLELTSIVKLPTNDPDKAQKATEAEKKRLVKKFSALGVDDVKISKEKIFLNLAE